MHVDDLREKQRAGATADLFARECPEFCVQGGLKFHCLLVDFTPRVS